MSSRPTLLCVHFVCRQQFPISLRGKVPKNGYDVKEIVAVLLLLFQLGWIQLLYGVAPVKVSVEREKTQAMATANVTGWRETQTTTRDAAASRDRFLWFASATSSGVRYKANDQQARREYALLCPVVSVEEMRGTSVVLAMQIACALHRNIASTLMSVTSKCWRNIKNKQISIYFWIVVFPNKGKWNLKKRD